MATLRSKAINVIIVIFHAWNLCAYLKAYRTHPHQDEEIVDLVKQYSSWKTIRILEKMTGNVVISEVDALVCVVLSKGEKHASYGELVGTTE